MPQLNNRQWLGMGVAAVALISVLGWNQSAHVSPSQTHPTDAVIVPTALPTTRATATSEPEPTEVPATRAPVTAQLWVDRTGQVYTGPDLDFPRGDTIYGPIKVTAIAVRNERGTYWYHVQSGKIDGWLPIIGVEPSIIASLPVDTVQRTIPPTEVPTATLPPTATAKPVPTPQPAQLEVPVISGGRVGAICRDGSRSSATGRGACSHHGGVDHWLVK